MRLLVPPLEVPSIIKHVPHCTKTCEMVIKVTHTINLWCVIIGHVDGMRRSHLWPDKNKFTSFSGPGTVMCLRRHINNTRSHQFGDKIKSSMKSHSGGTWCRIRPKSLFHLSHGLYIHIDFGTVSQEQAHKTPYSFAHFRLHKSFQCPNQNAHFKTRRLCGPEKPLREECMLTYGWTAFIIQRLVEGKSQTV
jgi:hypothetical protein